MGINRQWKGVERYSCSSGVNRYMKWCRTMFVTELVFLGSENKIKLKISKQKNKMIKRRVISHVSPFNPQDL